MAFKKHSRQTSYTPLPLSQVFKSEWQWCLAGAVFTFFLASLLMSGWQNGLFPNLDYPYQYQGDALSHSWIIQRLIEGWVFDNPRNGYPFGSNFLDYPSSDSANYLMIKLIALLGNKFQATFNLYFLLGFSVTFIASFCVFRALRLSLPFALSAAIIFDFLPFHFHRIGHLFYTWYFVIPLYYYIAFRVFFSHQETDVKTTLIKKLIYALSFILLSSFGLYYALFGIILFGVVFLAGLLGKFNPHVMKKAVLISCFISLGVLLNLLPNLWHWHEQGQNTEVAQRHAAESEIYGLKLMQLFLPRENHRINNWAEFTHQYKASPLVNENSYSSLGIIGAIGLLSLFLLMFARISGRAINKALALTALIVFVFFMFATIGGLGSMVSHIISPAIRAWNRISIFIGFGALLSFFILLQVEVQRRIHTRQRFFLSSGIAFCIVCLALYDQTIPTNTAKNKFTQNAFSLDKNFIHTIENLLPQKSAIFQLPYIPFPEAELKNKMAVYDLTAGFLHSTTLRWSLAGMKGRIGDSFYRSLSKEPLKYQLKALQKLGFSGIYIDRRGYADKTNKIMTELETLLARPATLIRSDQKIVFFQLDQIQAMDFTQLSPAQIVEKAGYTVDQSGIRYHSTLEEGIDFTRTMSPDTIKSITGLSLTETWGRWSDANLTPTVRINYYHSLPNTFVLVFSGKAFGPNQDLPVQIGSMRYTVKISKEISEYRLEVNLKGENAFQIEFLPPQAISPKQLGLSADKRKLGIGLVHLKLEVKN